MSVLVTGATGFLGTALCDRLVRDLDLVFLYRDIRYNSPFWKARQSWPEHVAVHGDVLDRRLVERVISEYGVSHVVHLAAQAQVSSAAADPTNTFEINVMGTLNVLEACRAQKVKRVVVASTDKVYGNSSQPVVECNPMYERNPYGASKVCADVIAQTYAKHYGMSVAVTRCANLYGPGHLNWSTLVPGTLRKLHERKRPLLRHGGKAVREFLFVEDAVDAYCRLLKSDYAGPLNFGTSNPMTILEMAEALCREWGASPGEIEIVEGGSGEIVTQSLVSAEAWKHLGWKPSVGFPDAVRSTVAWYRNYFSESGLCA